MVLFAVDDFGLDIFHCLGVFGVAVVGAPAGAGVVDHSAALGGDVFAVIGVVLMDAQDVDPHIIDQVLVIVQINQSIHVDCGLEAGNGHRVDHALLIED